MRTRARATRARWPAVANMLTAESLACLGSGRLAHSDSRALSLHLTALLPMHRPRHRGPCMPGCSRLGRGAPSVGQTAPRCASKRAAGHLWARPRDTGCQRRDARVGRLPTAVLGVPGTPRRASALLPCCTLEATAEDGRSVTGPSFARPSSYSLRFRPDCLAPPRPSLLLAPCASRSLQVEAQLWLCLLTLSTDPAVRARYTFTDYRKVRHARVTRDAAVARVARLRFARASCVRCPLRVRASSCIA